MKQTMHVVLAPMQLKPGVDEAKLLEASEAFQENFVTKQQGILRRILLKDGRGGYADLVFFESEEAFRRVAEAEATSEHCQALFQLMLPPDPSLPDMGVLSFHHVKTYE
jgi:hypothetical protein